jgi:hypothetical protein
VHFVSWIPTLRIARAAWKGSQDPAGLIRSQLGVDRAADGAQQPAPLPAALPAVAAAVTAPPTEPAVAEPVAARASTATATNLLLLLR